jgi:hypothetical protein
MHGLMFGLIVGLSFCLYHSSEPVRNPLLGTRSLLVASPFLLPLAVLGILGLEQAELKVCVFRARRSIVPRDGGPGFRVMPVQW